MSMNLVPWSSQGEPDPTPLDWLGKPNLSAPVRPTYWQIASIPRRGIACLIDMLILPAMMVAATYLIGERTTETIVRDGQLYFRIVAALSSWQARAVLLCWFGYLIVTERLFGATLGKRITRITTIRDDGTPLTVKSAVLRWLTLLIPVVALAGPKVSLTRGQAVIIVLSVLVVLFSPDHRRMGDCVAGTLVVRRTRPRRESVELEAQGNFPAPSFGFATGQVVPEGPLPPTSGSPEWELRS